MPQFDCKGLPDWRLGSLSVQCFRLLAPHLEGLRMPPRWIVNCPECRGEITHTDIRAMVTGVGTRLVRVAS
jgi:hypothetical protein